MSKKPEPAQTPGNAEGEERNLQVSAAPDLEYHYRDFFSLFVGAEEVTIDFGNRHRAQANRATVQNHIVLSIPNAIRLQQGLARSLEEARKRVQARIDQAGEAGKASEN